MKRIYIAATEKHGEKYCAYVIQVASSDNLLSKLSNPTLACAHAYGTRKEAVAVSTAWNQSYIENGTYLYAE